jgi:hypothetical protein
VQHRRLLLGVKRSCHSILLAQLQAAKAAVDLVQHQAKLEAADAALKQHAAALQEQHGSVEELPEITRVQLAGLMVQR